MRSAELLGGTHKEGFRDVWRILEDSMSGGKQRHRAQEQPTGCGIATTPGSGSGSGSGSGVLSDDSLGRSDQPIHSITP